jgi:hypothetical protein
MQVAGADAAIPDHVSSTPAALVNTSIAAFTSRADAPASPVAPTLVEAQQSSPGVPTASVRGSGEPESETNSLGVVIGASVAGVLLAAICAAAAWFMCWRNAHSEQAAGKSGAKPTSRGGESVKAPSGLTGSRNSVSDSHIVSMGSSRKALVGQASSKASDLVSPTGVHAVHRKVTAAVREMQGALYAELQKDQMLPLPQMKGLIGRGGFGTVYRGALPPPSMNVRFCQA